METNQTKITHHDWVVLYYTELMMDKAPGANPTVDELITVSERAAITFTETDDPQAIARLTDNLGHPYAAMWARGEIDGSIYYAWAYAIERPKAAEQVARTLAKRRAAKNETNEA